MIFIIILLCLGSILYAKAQDLSVGFIYKHDIPEEAFYLFDWLVVDPDNFPLEKLDEKFYIKNKKAKLIAYVSVGELEPYRSYYKKADKSWIIGENKGWNSKIADLRNSKYIDFLFENRFDMLKDYDGFFLDTLDSYQMVLKSDFEKSKYEEGIVNLINLLRKKYPNKIIITNRGFEIVDRIKDKIDAVVAESLFYGLEVGKTIKYKKMKPEDTQWLLEKLRYIKSLGLKVIVIDYIEPKNKSLQREVAKKIYQEGFIPYVSDKDLNSIGTSIYQLKPRKVLLLYDKKTTPDVAYADLHRLVQTWIEYIGLVPVLRNIDQVMEDSRFLKSMSDEYVGIIVNISDYPDPKKFLKWLVEKKEEGLKIFFIGNFGFSQENEYLKHFGISIIGQKNLFDEYEIVNSSFKFFETEPKLESIPLLTADKIKFSISAKSKGKTFYPLIITDWGGYALEGSFIVNYISNSLFVIHPIELFKAVFSDIDYPATDITTENGSRILTAHIDGDAGFGVADFDTSKNIMEITRDEIVRKYKIPHTISIIEGEIAPWGLYPEKSEKLQEIARSLLNLENVEAASHSFSHPFKWQLIEKMADEEVSENYNLTIPGYKFNLEREIKGSVEYIDNHLLKQPKKTKVFLWTGDCVPSLNALKLTYKLGLYNVNGGDTWINNKEPFYSLIAPMGLDREGYFQVYPPVQNENVYTNLWKDYYGYRKVIETFELTEQPYRLKPISIYYPFYSAQKISSLKALREVYEYALSKQVIPMFLSEYAQRVLEFRNMAFGIDIRDDSLIIRSEGNLKTLRVDNPNIYPDIFNSKGIVGFSKINSSLYISLDNSGEYKINFTQNEPKFYLINSNGQIVESYKDKDRLKFKIKSYLPLQFRIYIDRGCKLDIYKKPDILEKNGNIILVKYKEEKEGYVETYCQQ